MKVIKANLPEGTKKKFITKIGKKVKLVNKTYANRKKNKKRVLFFKKLAYLRSFL